jgi:hypothetical protein
MKTISRTYQTPIGEKFTYSDEALPMVDCKIISEIVEDEDGNQEEHFFDDAGKQIDDLN